MGSVMVIPARRQVGNTVKQSEQKKLRVAAYCRVSTDSEEQETSYEAQVDYYTKKIKERSDWVFVEVYTEMLTTTLIQMHPTCTQIAP